MTNETSLKEGAVSEPGMCECGLDMDAHAGGFGLLHHDEFLRQTAPALRESLEACVAWIASKCQPDADWAAQGHNWSMSNDEREMGSALLQRARSILQEISS